MARSKSGIVVRAIAALVGYFVLNQFTAFVGPSPTSTGYRRQLRPSVIMAAISKDDVQRADRDARLLVWAARTLASKGAPQTDMMQAKAEKAVQVVEVLKRQFQEQEAGKPVVPAVLARAAPAYTAAAAAPGAISKDDVQKAERDARLLLWAAQRLASEGAPQTGMMQAKADKALQALEALKQQFQKQEAARKSGARAAAPTTPVAPTYAMSLAPSAEEVSAAKKTADLQAWALKRLVAAGAPEAAAMQAKAAESARKYEALKAAHEEMVSDKQMVLR